MNTNCVHYNMVQPRQQKVTNKKETIASAILPGCGQLMQGRKKDAFVDFATSLGLASGAMACASLSEKIAAASKSTVFKTIMPTGPNVKNAKLKLAALGVGTMVFSAAALANKVCSAIDAYNYNREDFGCDCIH